MEWNELKTRYKILSIEYEDVLTYLMELKSYITILDRKELPPRYIISSVYLNHQTRCFNFVVHHESFDVVQLGAEPKRWDIPLYTRKMYDVKEHDHN